MEIIDGKKIAQKILAELKEEVAALPFQPVFCDVLVGNNPVSAQYVRMKGKMAERIGMRFRKAEFPATITTKELTKEISSLNLEPYMSGLIVQLPLPTHIDKKTILNAIDPRIDVDCIGETNSNLFYSGKTYLKFPTAAAIMVILDSVGVELKGKKVLVIGRGELVGRPVSFLLRQKGLNVRLAHSSTGDLPALIKTADVIISATGRSRLIKGDMIKPGSIVIDAGTSEQNGSIVGDVDLASVEKVSGLISPVPGGVGPVTVAMLLKNVLIVAKNLVKQ